MTAFHEAGHALVARLIPNTDPVHKISILPRGMALGYTLQLPSEDKYTMPRSELLNEISVLLGGRVAEKIIFDDITTGASSDMERATKTARNMVTRWGMSDRLGFVYYGEDQLPGGLPRFDFGQNKDFSDKTSEIIDEEVKRIIDAAYADARRLIADNRDKLEAVAQALVKYETISGEEVHRIMAGETLDRPTVADLIAFEQDRRQDALPIARPVQRPRDESTGPLPSPA